MNSGRAGYFPLKVEALPEGTCIHAHVPVFQMTTTGDYAPLCTFLETLLTMVWCATLSLSMKLPAYSWHSTPALSCPPLHIFLSCLIAIQ